MQTDRWTRTQIGDLKRFLQMYEVWQRRVFPGIPHEEFVEKVEKEGSKGHVQMALKALRLEAMRTAERGEFGEDEEDEDGVFDWAEGGLVAQRPAADGGGNAAPSTVPATKADDGAGAHDDDDNGGPDDDDDFDQYMQEPRAATATEDVPEIDEEDEDLPDELFMDDADS